MLEKNVFEKIYHVIANGDTLKKGEFKFLLQRTREECLAQNFPYYPTPFNTSLEISLAEDPKMNLKKKQKTV